MLAAKPLIVPVNSKKAILIQDRRGYKKLRTGAISAEEFEDETPIQADQREQRRILQLLNRRKLKFWEPL